MDFSTAVWGHDMAVVGVAKDDYPSSRRWYQTGEEFSYEVNVYKGIMYLTLQVKPRNKDFYKESNFL